MVDVSKRIPQCRATDGLLVEVMGKYLWMAVTADEYELPICVADTARELGEKYGVTADTVITLARDDSSGKIIGKKYVKVRNDEWHR